MIVSGQAITSFTHNRCPATVVLRVRTEATGTTSVLPAPVSIPDLSRPFPVLLYFFIFMEHLKND